MAAQLAFNDHLRRTVEADCSVCTDESREADRLRWGCDEPGETWATIECCVCHGKLAECDNCKGTGTVKLNRCPRFYVDDSEMLLCEVAQLIEVGQDPLGIPVMDWPARFFDALRIINAERASIVREEQERARREAEQKQRSHKRGR